jgi:hypothetical protein
MTTSAFQRAHAAGAVDIRTQGMRQEMSDVSKDPFAGRRQNSQRGGSIRQADRIRRTRGIVPAARREEVAVPIVSL